MDPLSVAASIAGLLTAAREVGKILGPFISAAGKMPQIAFKVHSEVQNTSSILIELDELIKYAEKSSPKSISLLTVDQLATVLTGGVLIFAELESASKDLLQVMAAPSSKVLQLRCRLQWQHNEDTFVSLLTRLEAFKSSLTAMLSIWMCGSVDRAEQRHMELLASLDNLMKTNEALSQRLKALEDSDGRTIVTRRTTLNTLRPVGTIQEESRNEQAGEGSKTAVESQGMRFSQTTANKSIFAFDFEPDLEASWVYRRINRDTMDFSCRSSTAPSHGWSMLSGLSISKVSKISVIALPVYSEDLTNAQHYHFGGRLSNSGLTHSQIDLDRQRLMAHACARIKRQLLRTTGFSELFDEAKNDGAIDTDPIGELRHVLQRGFPLLLLLSYWTDGFDMSLFLPAVRSSVEEKKWLAKLAIQNFLRKCALLLDTDRRDLFSVEDLLSGSSLGFTKVVTVVEILISKLQDPWMGPPSHDQTKSSLKKDTITAAPGKGHSVENLILDERVHLLQLEHLLELKTALQGAELLSEAQSNEIFGPISLIIGCQFALLLDLEATMSLPIEDQCWAKPFLSWMESPGFGAYETLARREFDSKKYIKYRIAASGIILRDDQLNLLRSYGDFLSTPRLRLDEYHGFLQQCLGRPLSSKPESPGMENEISWKVEAEHEQEVYEALYKIQLLQIRLRLIPQTKWQHRTLNATVIYSSDMSRIATEQLGRLELCDCIAIADKKESKPLVHHMYLFETALLCVSYNPYSDPQPALFSNIELDRPHMWDYVGVKIDAHQMMTIETGSRSGTYICMVWWQGDTELSQPEHLVMTFESVAHRDVWAKSLKSLVATNKQNKSESSKLNCSTLSTPER